MEQNKISQFRGKYYFLSNFYPATVTYDGLTYQNSEAAFQAQKCVSFSEKEPFTKMLPDEAKKEGRFVHLRDDWEDVKYSVMEEIVRAKFYQNPDIRERLLKTGDAYLEEGNFWGDRTWGVVNGNGKNWLGEILMKIREELKKEG